MTAPHEFRAMLQIIKGRGSCLNLWWFVEQGQNQADWCSTCCHWCGECEDICLFGSGSSEHFQKFGRRSFLVGQQLSRNRVLQKIKAGPPSPLKDQKCSCKLCNGSDSWNTLRRSFWPTQRTAIKCMCWYIPVQFLTVHVYWHYCPYSITTSYSNPAGVEVSRSNVRRVFNSLELFKLAAKLIRLSYDTVVMQSGC